MRIWPSRIAPHCAASVCVVAWCCLYACCAAQEKSPRVDTEQAKEWAEKASRLALAEAQSYEIRLDDDRAALKLSETPVLKWSNTYEASIYGNTYVWTRAGRPEVIACFFKFYTTKTSFDLEFHSLAEKGMTAKKNGVVAWEPDAGVARSPLDDAPVPAKTAAGRLVQMRALARDFSCTAQTVLEPKTKHNLRLLPQPLFRYGDGDDTLLDGALFAFARETDPDAILILEARKTEPPRWQFAFARMHVGELSARYQDKEVWSVAELKHPYSRQDEAYTLLQDLPEPKLEP